MQVQQQEQHELLARNPGMPAQGYNPQAYNNPQLYNNPQVTYAGQPVYQQPQIQFMPRPPAIPGVPTGLEYLTQVDQLLIHQQMELLEIMSDYECENKYQIKNTIGQQVYFAAEESDFCNRQCCGSSRGFVLHIADNMGQEALRVVREFRCCAGFCSCCVCCDSCSCEIRVEAPVGQVIGYVRQIQSCMRPRYSILDANRQEVLYVEGPGCVCQGPCCTADQEFRIFTQDRTQEIGKITKQWSGFVREMMTKSDNFSVSFPQDLDVHFKATLIAAVFLIDFMYFEQKQQKKDH